MSGPARELTLTKETHQSAAVVRATVPAPPQPASRSLRILMLSWEYPPVLVGGLGRHVHALATRLAAGRPRGHRGDPARARARPWTRWSTGVRVVRAPEDPPRIPLDTPHLLAWTMAFNHTLTRDRAARHRRASSTTWSTPTTGSSPTPPSPCGTTWASRWWPRCTPPRPAGTRAGCPAT